VLKAPKVKKRVEDEAKTTQLDEVIKNAQRTVKENEYRMPRALWLPDLEEATNLDHVDKALDVPMHKKGECAICAPVGTYDNPAHQYQGTVWVDFTEYGHYAICGEQGSGKSVFLQSMLMSLMRAYTPDELNIYCVDYSNNMLRSLMDAPQVGDVVPEGDKEPIEKLFYMLDGLINERRELLSGSSFSAYRRRHPQERVPAIVVAIDQYGAFRDKTEQLYDDRMVSLTRDGATLGIFFVITAAGIGSSDVPNKLMGQIRGRLCLAMGDDLAYRDLLGVDRCEVLPTSGVSGRGLARVGEEALEFQTALVAGIQDDTERKNAIVKELAVMQDTYVGYTPAPHIPKVPDDPILSEFLSNPKVKAMLQDDVSLPLGYDMTSAEPMCIRLDQFFCYLVSGKLKSGTTEFLCTFLRVAAQKGDAIIHVIGAGRTAVQRVAEECGATYHPAGEDLFPYLSQEFTKEVVTRNTRKHNLEMSGVEENELFVAMSDEKNYFVIFEDFAAFVNMAYSPDGVKKEYPRVFETFFSRGWYHRMYMICCVDQSRLGTASSMPVYKLVTQDGAGMHFGGRSNRQNTLSFDWLPSYKEGDRMRPPGVGMAASGEFCVGHGNVAIPDYRR
jgi:S-DNA-T family DNA segregation ATPase FtsK/SpoIIIE